MTFSNDNGILIIDTGQKLIASTSSHVVEKTPDGHIRLTFGPINLEFEEDEISFNELIKLLPQ